jgi:NitT/TauT family transport system substrate-binding protein
MNYNAPMPRTPAFFAIILLCITALPALAELPVVRVGVLQFGTVNWELEVIRQHQLDLKHGFRLEVQGYGGKNATHVALQGGAVDVIVSDWIWVNRQRALGRDYSFSPYSNATGALMVRADSGIETLDDLNGRKIGIAGGPLDKTWLLMRAYSQHKLGQDMKDLIQPNFAAPPLLNKLAERGELDGAINFWHYAARLKAAGFRALLPLAQVLQELGIQRPLPLIGWVFSERWALDNPAAVAGLLRASQEAKSMLMQSDAEWTRLRGMMKADSDAVFNALVEGFREGIPGCFGEREITAAGDTYAVMAKTGGESLTDRATTLDERTFWKGQPWKPCPE